MLEIHQQHEFFVEGNVKVWLASNVSGRVGLREAGCKSFFVVVSGHGIGRITIYFLGRILLGTNSFLLGNRFWRLKRHGWPRKNTQLLRRCQFQHGRCLSWKLEFSKWGWGIKGLFGWVACRIRSQGVASLVCAEFWAARHCLQPAWDVDCHNVIFGIDYQLF